MFKKTIKRCAELDLRSYSADALREIKKISMCAVVIIPSDADKQWYDTFSKINILMCGKIISVKKDDRFITLNGLSVINDKTFSGNCHFLVNGIAIIETKEKCPVVTSNGICIRRDSSAFNMADNNGITAIIEDEAPYRTYPNKINLNRDTVNHFDEGTVVIAGNSICVGKDVTEEILLSKRIRFIAGKDVICNNNVYGYVNANSHTGNRIKKYNEK